MTALSVVQGAATKLGLEVPDTIVGTDRTLAEIREALNDAARVIADAYDWQALKQPGMLTGDGSKVDFDFPEDYARMTRTAQLWPSDRVNWPLTSVLDENQWQQIVTQDYATVPPGMWTIYGGQIHVRPAPSDTVTLSFFYIRNTIVKNGTTPKVEFVLDDDTFVLDERLLKLCFIWRWKMAKGQTFAGEEADYQDAKDVLIGADKGPRVLTIGRQRYHGDTRMAYPGVIVLS